jgi:hypothetical protein
VVVAAAGCLEAGEGEPGGAADAEGVASGLVVGPNPPSGLTARADALKPDGTQRYVETNPGSWGSWTAPRYCPLGAFAVGYKMRAEPQTAGDKTAVNAIELACMDGQGNLSTAEAHEGLWGSWSPNVMCANTFLKGGAVRFQPSRGSGDDSAANDFRAVCGDNATLQATGGSPEGTWNATKSCDAGYSVCGISVRFESYQGGGNGTGNDDTALNAVRLHCCPNATPTTKLRISDVKLPGIIARTFSPDAGKPLAPLILVEGFDRDGSFDVDSMPSKMPAGFLGALGQIGYSVTFVDLTSNWDRIQNNARRVGALANKLWAESAQARPLKMVGASMGGLIVTTTAVMKDKWAELGEPNPGWTFKVDHVTTMDSPHAGAYIPKALYNLFRRFNDFPFYTTLSLYNAIVSDATSQMALIPFDDAGKRLRDDWQQYYAKVLGLMRRSDVRFVGIVNGSWTGAVQFKDWTPGTVNVKFSDHEWYQPLSYWVYLMTQPEVTQDGINQLSERVAQINLDFVTDEDDVESAFYPYPGTWPLVENTAGGYTDHWAAVAKEMKTSARWGRHSFVQTWSSAGISYPAWLGLPALEQNNLAILEATRGPVAGSVLSPFDRILKTNVNNEHPFVPSTLGPKFVAELQAAFPVPTTKVIWTDWLDRDDPWGNGDGEHFGLFTGIQCQQPLTAECRRISDGVDHSRTGERVRCSPAGAECLNAEQPDGQCDDYEVRFACPDPAMFTAWLDRDDPTGNGDGEHLGLHVQDGNTCAEPIGVECQTTGGLAWQSTGEKVLCQANKGANCLNADQADGWCEDYRVRFICPKSGAWTPWLSADIQDGDGDDESLLRHVLSGKSCPQPLAAECRRTTDKKDWTETGQKVVCSPAQGLLCRNVENGVCANYEVRFFCPGPWAAP